MVYSLSNLRRWTIHLEKNQNHVLSKNGRSTHMFRLEQYDHYVACTAIPCATLDEMHLSTLRFQMAWKVCLLNFPSGSTKKYSALSLADK